MRQQALNQTGGWDAHNVTEDADLSFRLAARGWGIGYLRPPTLEEAVTHWTPWCDQRARWMKGYLQTWMVHMQKPLAPGGRKAAARMLTLQITLGASLLSGLFHALIITAFFGAALYSLHIGHGLTVMWPIIVSTGFAYSVNILIGAVGVIRAKKHRLLWSVPFMPFYWILLIVPSWIAVMDLFTQPYHWRKTAHGLTHMRPTTQIQSSPNTPHHTNVKPAALVITPSRPN